MTNANGGERGELERRLACADSSFPRLSHETALRVIADLGFGAADVCVFPVAHTHPREMRADPAACAAAIAERLGAADLAVADVFVILGEEGFDQLAVNHPDAAVRAESFAYFEAAVELASRLGAPGVSTLPGTPFEGVDPEASQQLAAEELQRRAELAAAAGLRLSVEPHVGSIAETPEAAQRLLDLAPDLTLALDHSHFVYQGLAQEEADGLIPRTGHVHLRQAAPGEMQLPAREGSIDFSRLLASLAAGGYDGYLTIEYQWEEWLGCNRVDCVAETAELRDLLLGG